MIQIPIIFIYFVVPKKILFYKNQYFKYLTVKRFITIIGILPLQTN